MDLRITFDISDKLDTALCRLAAAIEAAGVCKALPVHSEAVECPAKSVETAPAAPIVSGQIITQPEPETVKTELVLAQSEAVPEPAANDDAKESPEAEPEPAKKPAKKKAAKKAEAAPVAQSEPESAKAEEPAKAADDGMAGMNLMEAARQLIEDIQDAGIEMADANARVRAKADELGLNFGSITCLIKAIGYVEARKVAIGK